MTPREYIEIARERWRSIVAGLLVGLIAAGAAVYLVPRQYAAPVTMMVASQATGDPAGSSSNADGISAQRLDAYIELLQSRRLAQDVIGTLRLNTTPEDLGDRIAVTTAPESVLFTATVTSGTPDDAVRIANAVADEFVKDVADLERPADPARQPLVVARVFQSAELPAEQVAPRPALYLALGAVLGLVIGLAAALLGHALDSRIKNRRQLEDALGAPVLGAIGRDPKIPSSPLVMYGAPHTPLAEAFRQLRTNVQFLDVDREHKVILVTSATAGEGRSTTVCNLGLALAEAGTRVLVLDADLRDPSVAGVLGLGSVVGLTDVLVNRISVERALQPVGPTLDVLPSGPLPPNPSELLGSNRMVKLLATLRGRYDVILIDAAPLIPVTDAAVLAPRCDGVLVVVRHGRTVVQEVQAAKEAVTAVSGRIFGSVMTMVPHSGSRTHSRVKPRKGARPRALGQVPTGGLAQPSEAVRADAQGSAPSPGHAPRQRSDANGQVRDHDETAAR